MRTPAIPPFFDCRFFFARNLVGPWADGDVVGRASAHRPTPTGTDAVRRAHRILRAGDVPVCGGEFGRDGAGMVSAVPGLKPGLRVTTCRPTAIRTGTHRGGSRFIDPPTESYRMPMVGRKSIANEFAPMGCVMGPCRTPLVDGKSAIHPTPREAMCRFVGAKLFAIGRGVIGPRPWVKAHPVGWIALHRSTGGAMPDAHGGQEKHRE